MKKPGRATILRQLADVGGNIAPLPPTTLTVASPLTLVPKQATALPVLDIVRAAVIRDVWGDDILSEPTKVNAITKAQDEIAEESSKVLHAAINMGRSLIDVRQALTPAEFQRGMRQSAKAWRGLSQSNVVKLMSVASWWDQGRLPADRAPQHYTVLYEFTTLPDDVLQRAIDIGVFRPDVTRNEVVGFKRRITEVVDGPRKGEPPSRSADFERLAVRRRQLLSELVAIRRQMLSLRS
jgi:hypothetical protein